MQPLGQAVVSETEVTFTLVGNQHHQRFALLGTESKNKQKGVETTSRVCLSSKSADNHTKYTQTCVITKLCHLQIRQKGNKRLIRKIVHLVWLIKQSSSPVEQTGILQASQHRLVLQKRFKGRSATESEAICLHSRSSQKAII